MALNRSSSPTRLSASAQKKILVVDDEPKVRQLIKDTLERAGYRVVETHRGDAAISLAQSHHPDLLVLDVLLAGGLDGVQVYHRLKGKSSTRKIPVIFVTATAPGDTVATQELPLGERCVVIGKPFRLDALLREVRQLLGS